MHRFFRLPHAERIAVVEALVALPVAWASVRLATPAQLVRLMTALPVRSSRRRAVESSRLAQVVSAVAAHLPLQCLCLEQSLAAAWMLRRRGVAASIVLGIATPRGAFDAHAWVEVDGRGPVAAHRYVPLQRFSS